MNTHSSYRSSSFYDERGVYAPLMAGSLMMFLAILGLSIDIGQALVAKNELHDTADAAALAGTRQLATIYEAMPTAAQATYTLSTTDAAAIKAMVIAVGSQNAARGTAVEILPGDIQIGAWDTTTRTFTPGTVTPNAVRVQTRRDPSVGAGGISTYIARVFNVSTLNVSAFATAALTGPAVTPPGDLDTPFGISSFRFSTPYCNQPVTFYPSNDPTSCAGWHTYFTSPPNANTLRNIIDTQLIPNPPTSPGTAVGDDLNFIGGNVASALPNLYNLYVTKRDPSTGIWTALVPVYQSNDCSNPNTALPIVGYATMQITTVLAPPAGQLVQGTVACNVVDGGRGGGGNYGTLGTIPGLVQ
ncbi:MAG TPA: TadG family pilus assembly protein [Nitrospira sp.]|nr:TadG family pilus assembly protein [Nitrospira sp.]